MLRTEQQIVKVIKAQQKIQGITNVELAKKLGLEQSIITRYWNGTRRIPFALFQKIADALKIPVESLLIQQENNDSLSYTELNYYDISDNSKYNYKEINVLFDENASQTILVPNVTLGNYAGVKNICIFRMDTSSVNQLMPNTKTIAVKQVPNNQLVNGDIVVFQNCHGLDVRLYFNDTKAKIISFIPKSTDKKRERFNYRYKDAWHFQIIGKVVLNTVQTKNYLA